MGGYAQAALSVEYRNAFLPLALCAWRATLMSPGFAG
jgi:hypothetical protein